MSWLCEAEETKDEEISDDDLPKRVLEMFERFCAFGGARGSGNMDGARFAKFNRDTGLLDKSFTSTDVDLIFAKVKKKGQRVITVETFREALAQVAVKKGLEYNVLVRQVLRSDGPNNSGTQSLPTLPHEVHQRLAREVNPSKSAPSLGAALAEMQDELGSPPSRPDPRADPLLPRGLQGRRRSLDDQDYDVPPPDLEFESDQLYEVFCGFCAFGGGQSTGEEELVMTSAKFMKLNKDCGLLDRKVNSTEVDLIFTKVKPKGQHHIGFDAFRLGLAQVAHKKGVGYCAVVASTIRGKGPVSTGTKSDTVRFHDDKRSYTGVHKNGGPTTVDDKDSGLLLVKSRSEPNRLQSRVEIDSRVDTVRKADSWDQRGSTGSNVSYSSSEGILEEELSPEMQSAAEMAARRASDLAASLSSCQAQLRTVERNNKMLEAEKEQWVLEKCQMLARIAALESEGRRSRANSECFGEGRGTPSSGVSPRLGPVDLALPTVCDCEMQTQELDVLVAPSWPAAALRHLGAMIVTCAVDATHRAVWRWLTHCKVGQAQWESLQIAAHAVEMEEQAVEQLEASQEEALELAHELAVCSKELKKLEVANEIARKCLS